MANATTNAPGPSQGTAVCPELSFSVNMVTYNASQTSRLVSVLTSVFLALVCPFAVLGNVSVFVAVLRKAELRTVYNTSILFLAATDLVVALVPQPAFVVYQVSKIIEEHFSCTALVTYTSAVFLCSGFSILTLILITLERYLAIFHPYRYRDCVTKPRIISTTVCTWIIYGVSISLARFYFSASTVTYSIVATVLILACILITLYVYCRVYALTQRVRPVRPSVEQQGSYHENARNSTAENVRETKSSKTVTYITGAVVLCFLPTVCASAVYQARLLHKDVIYHIIYPITDCAVLLSALLDPLIYVLRSRRIQNSLKEVFRRRVTISRESIRDRTRTANSIGVELKPRS